MICIRLFLELLQECVYRAYTAMLERQSERTSGSVRERLDWGARRVAEVQADGNGRWLFELWLELLAHASRDPEFAKLAAGQGGAGGDGGLSMVGPSHLG